MKSIAIFRGKHAAVHSCLLAVLWVAAMPVSVAHEDRPVLSEMTSEWQKVLAALSIPGNYRAKWLRLTEPVFSGMHWNHYVVVYTNQAVEPYRGNHKEFQRWFGDNDDWFEEEEGEGEGPNFTNFPVGTVLVKENYSVVDNKPGRLHSLSIMRKQAAGFDPALGDWEYMELEMSGNRLVKGKGSDPLLAAKCGQCHANVADRDYVFTSEMDPKLLED